MKKNLFKTLVLACCILMTTTTHAMAQRFAPHLFTLAALGIGATPMVEIARYKPAVPTEAFKLKNGNALTIKLERDSSKPTWPVDLLLENTFNSFCPNGQLSDNDSLYTEEDHTSYRNFRFINKFIKPGTFSRTALAQVIIEDKDPVTVGHVVYENWTTNKPSIVELFDIQIYYSNFIGHGIARFLEQHVEKTPGCEEIKLQAIFEESKGFHEKMGFEQDPEVPLSFCLRKIIKKN